MVQVDFGDALSVSHQMIEAAKLPAPPETVTIDDHVVVAFTWTDGTNGSWKELFTMQTTSGSSTITFKTNTTQFYSGNILSSSSGFSLTSGSIGSGVVPAPTGGVQSVANEFVRKMANTIFQREGAADLLSNEAELVSDITDNWGTGSDGKLLNDIRDALAPANYENDKTDSNPAAIVLNTLKTNSETQNRFNSSVDLETSTTDSNFERIPVRAGDQFIFSITINAADHNIGSNTVAPRKYKFIITLA